MQQYKIVIAYDGTAYHGWQIQPEMPTIAGMLQKRFYDVFKKEIKLTGASRTDAGVHAMAQVAIFTLDDPIDPEKLIFAWNNTLPGDILIRSCDFVSLDFHPQRDVEEKTYYYHFFEKRPLPFLARYGYYHGSFDRAKLVEGLQQFIGTHDFRSFCTGHEQESTVRTIHSIDLQTFKRYGVHRITVKGPGFLRYMIRRIVGACLDIASSPSLTHVDLINALAECNPHQHLYVAPPQGLVLHSIKYK